MPRVCATEKKTKKKKPGVADRQVSTRCRSSAVVVGKSSKQSHHRAVATTTTHPKNRVVVVDNNDIFDFNDDTLNFDTSGIISAADKKAGKNGKDKKATTANANSTASSSTKKKMNGAKTKAPTAPRIVFIHRRRKRKANNSNDDAAATTACSVSEDGNIDNNRDENNDGENGSQMQGAITSSPTSTTTTTSSSSSIASVNNNQKEPRTTKNSLKSNNVNNNLDNGGKSSNSASKNSKEEKDHHQVASVTTTSPKADIINNNVMNNKLEENENVTTTTTTRMEKKSATITTSGNETNKKQFQTTITTTTTKQTKGEEDILSNGNDTIAEEKEHREVVVLEQTSANDTSSNTQEDGINASATVTSVGGEEKTNTQLQSLSEEKNHNDVNDIAIDKEQQEVAVETTNNDIINRKEDGDMPAATTKVAVTATATTTKRMNLRSTSENNNNLNSIENAMEQREASETTEDNIDNKKDVSSKVFSSGTEAVPTKAAAAAAATTVTTALDKKKNLRSTSKNNINVDKIAKEKDKQEADKVNINNKECGGSRKAAAEITASGDASFSSGTADRRENDKKKNAHAANDKEKSITNINIIYSKEQREADTGTTTASAESSIVNPSLSSLSSSSQIISSSIKRRVQVQVTFPSVEAGIKEMKDQFFTKLVVCKKTPHAISEKVKNGASLLRINETSVEGWCLMDFESHLETMSKAEQLICLFSQFVEKKEGSKTSSSRSATSSSSSSTHVASSSLKRSPKNHSTPPAHVAPSSHKRSPKNHSTPPDPIRRQLKRSSSSMSTNDDTQATTVEEGAKKKKQESKHPALEMDKKEITGHSTSNETLHDAATTVTVETFTTTATFESTNPEAAVTEKEKGTVQEKQGYSSSTTTATPPPSAGQTVMAHSLREELPKRTSSAPTSASAPAGQTTTDGTESTDVAAARKDIVSGPQQKDRKQTSAAPAGALAPAGLSATDRNKSPDVALASKDIVSCPQQEDPKLASVAPAGASDPAGQETKYRRSSSDVATSRTAAVASPSAMCASVLVVEQRALGTNKSPAVEAARRGAVVSIQKEDSKRTSTTCSTCASVQVLPKEGKETTIPNVAEPSPMMKDATASTRRDGPTVEQGVLTGVAAAAANLSENLNSTAAAAECDGDKGVEAVATETFSQVKVVVTDEHLMMMLTSNLVVWKNTSEEILSPYTNQIFVEDKLIEIDGENVEERNLNDVVDVISKLEKTGNKKERICIFSGRRSAQADEPTNEASQLREESKSHGATSEDPVSTSSVTEITGALNAPAAAQKKCPPHWTTSSNHRAAASTNQKKPPPEVVDLCSDSETEVGGGIAKNSRKRKDPPPLRLLESSSQRNQLPVPFVVVSNTVSQNGIKVEADEEVEFRNPPRGKGARDRRLLPYYHHQYDCERVDDYNEPSMSDSRNRICDPYHHCHHEHKQDYRRTSDPHDRNHNEYINDNDEVFPSGGSKKKRRSHHLQEKDYRQRHAGYNLFDHGFTNEYGEFSLSCRNHKKICRSQYDKDHEQQEDFRYGNESSVHEDAYSNQKNRTAARENKTRRDHHRRRRRRNNDNESLEDEDDYYNRKHRAVALESKPGRNRRHHNRHRNDIDSWEDEDDCHHQMACPVARESKPGRNRHHHNRHRNDIDSWEDEDDCYHQKVCPVARESKPGRNHHNRHRNDIDSWEDEDVCYHQKARAVVRESKLGRHRHHRHTNYDSESSDDDDYYNKKPRAVVVRKSKPGRSSGRDYAKHRRYNSDSSENEIDNRKPRAIARRRNNGNHDARSSSFRKDPNKEKLFSKDELDVLMYGIKAFGFGKWGEISKQMCKKSGAYFSREDVKAKARALRDRGEL